MWFVATILDNIRLVLRYWEPRKVIPGMPEAYPAAGEQTEYAEDSIFSSPFSLGTCYVDFLYRLCFFGH